MADEGWKLPEPTVVVKDGKSIVYPAGSDKAPKSAVPAHEVAAREAEKTDGGKK